MTDGDVDHSLFGHLAAARAASGSPSLRAIAARTDYSHTTVAKAFSPSADTLSWPAVEQVAEAVGADVHIARRLWNHDGTKSEPPRPQRQRAQLRMPALAVACGLLLSAGVTIAVMQAVDPDTTRSTLITDMMLLVVAGIATVAFAIRAYLSHTRGDRRTGVFFGWIAVGMLAWTLGQLLWFLERNVDDQRVPTSYLHDIGWLAAPVAIGIALHMRAGDYGLGRTYRMWQRMVSLVCVAGASYAWGALLLAWVGFDVRGSILVFLLYPAADLVLAAMALVPLICGHRITGSMVLVTALLAATASDTGYVMLRADPPDQGFPAPAALGYLAFTIVMTIYAAVAQPLPAHPRLSVRRWVPSLPVTALFDALTAVCAGAAVAFSLAILLTRTGGVLAVLAAVVVVAATGALTASLALSTRRATR